MSPNPNQTPLIEGKTKILWRDSTTPTEVDVESKSDITAGDGKKHDVLTGKAAWSTTTTSNVFAFLKRNGFHVAFREQTGETRFRALLCDMLPYEVVVRGEAHGSYCERHPETPRGTELPLPCEFYLKTSGRNWEGHDLICDDPLIGFDVNRGIDLKHPKDPLQSVFLTLPFSEVFSYPDELSFIGNMQDTAKTVFVLLRSAWEHHGLTLVDFKLEFGIDPDGRLPISDVIDNDSWRLTRDGKYLDKQVYRDGGNLSEVARNYAEVARLSAFL